MPCELLQMQAKTAWSASARLKTLARPRLQLATGSGHWDWPLGLVTARLKTLARPRLQLATGLWTY